MALSKDQENALLVVDIFLRDKEETAMVIAGPAGTGKSFLTKEIIELAKNLDKVKDLILGIKPNFTIHITASTNKAASVLSDMLNMHTTTIHSLLGLKVTNDIKTGKTVLKKTASSEIQEDALIILDEASMVDSELLQIIRESTKNCKIIYIGDQYQLAPVFEADSPVFKSIPNKVELTEIMRQAAGSPIIQLAHSFRQTVYDGVFPTITPNGAEVITVDGDRFQHMIDTAYTVSKGKNNYAKIVAWRNKRVHLYNDYVRKLLGAPKELTVGEYLVTNNPIIGDNNRVLAKTDQTLKITSVKEGIVENIEGYSLTLNNSIEAFVPKNLNVAKSYLNSFAKAKQWPEYFRLKDKFADLRPIHASTVFKAQGSTYNTTFIDLEDILKCTNKNTIARMIYVAVSRASHKVVICGEIPDKLRG